MPEGNCEILIYFNIFDLEKGAEWPRWARIILIHGVSDSFSGSGVKNGFPTPSSAQIVGVCIHANYGKSSVKIHHFTLSIFCSELVNKPENLSFVQKFNPNLWPLERIQIPESKTKLST